MNDGSKDLNQTDEGDLLSAAEVSDEVRLPPSWCGEDFQLFGMALIALGALRGRRSAAKLLTKDEARRIAANIAKLPELLGRKSFGGFFPIRFSKPECRRLRPPWTPITTAGTDRMPNSSARARLRASFMLRTMTSNKEPASRLTTSITPSQSAHPALNTSTLRLLSMVCLQLQTHGGSPAISPSWRSY